MTKIIKNWKRIEVYGVSISDKDSQNKLKAHWYKWYPPKQCWTIYGDGIETIQSVLWATTEETTSDKTDTQELNDCIACTDEMAQKIIRLEQIIQEQAETIKRYEGKTKKSNKAPKKNLTDFLAKKSDKKILQMYVVKDWYITATDSKKYITKPTTLTDWVYKSVDPVVLSSEQIEEAPVLPTKEDFETIASFEYNKETIEAIKYHIMKSISQWFIYKKNYTPIFTWRLIGAWAIFATDSIGLYLAEDKNLDNPIYILPYDSACLFLSIDTSDRSETQTATITLCDKVQKPVNTLYCNATNWSHVFIEYKDTIMSSFLIQGNYPDYRSNKIIPDYEATPVDTTWLDQKLQIEKIEKLWYIKLESFTANTKHAKLLPDWSRQQRGQKDPVFSKVDNVTRVFRPMH